MMPVEAATVIHASWIVAYRDGDHHLLENGVVAYIGNRILHIGKSFDGPVARHVDAGGSLVIPGLISTHAHIGANYGDLLIIDGGRADLLGGRSLNYVPVKRDGGAALLDGTDQDASIRHDLGLLLRHGVTAVVDMGGGLFDGGETLVRRARESGLRLCYSPSYNPGRYTVEPNGRVVREIDEDRALKGLEQAGEFISRHAGQDRFQGMLVAGEAFNCTPRIWEATRRAADALDVGVTFELAEQLYEFQDALRRTGRSPVRLVEEAGLLRPRTVLGHCTFTGGSAHTAYAYDDDLERLAQSGATVSHCPTAGMRRGTMLDSFDRYRKHGIRMSIGTDAYPLDMIAEMRNAALLGKIADHSVEASDAGAIFRAATLGGAEALGRHDLGRLAVGAKADIVTVNLARLGVGPVFDPVRALLHAATGDCVESVVVDGTTVVDNGRMLAFDGQADASQVRGGSATIRRNFASYHWAGRELEQVYPPSLLPWSFTPVQQGGPDA